LSFESISLAATGDRGVEAVEKVDPQIQGQTTTAMENMFS
jgi:hypothetical protein